MDDSCAVCAEALQWVAHGSCGHREVCSTCVVRLRFVSEDHRCCLCKSESRIIFVTKVVMYVCDKTNERSVGFKRKGDFKNVEQLRSHSVHRHRLLTCSLCLESRKAFICEQKLDTKAQLDQHVKTGDSEVDGSETERGGFMVHPLCEFCQNPFYGENELYSHMSTEHYTCHICQRQHPGQYEYYKNYDDLEVHFRQAHFLCEDEACLEKKFVVHATESEMKMPISFQYWRSTQQDCRRRGCRLPSDLTDNQLSLSIQASLETSNAESSRNSSSSVGPVSDHRETSEFESVSSFEVLATTDCEPSSVSSHALRLPGLPDWRIHPFLHFLLLQSR